MTPKEALQKLWRDTYPKATETWSVNNMYEHWHIVEQSLNELEELKKRDTPMKLTQASRFTTDKRLYGMYACNSCHGVIPYITFNSKRLKPKFCYHCGQKIDWEIEK